MSKNALLRSMKYVKRDLSYLVFHIPVLQKVSCQNEKLVSCCLVSIALAYDDLDLVKTGLSAHSNSILMTV